MEPNPVKTKIKENINSKIYMHASRAQSSEPTHGIESKL